MSISEDLARTSSETVFAEMFTDFRPVGEGRVRGIRNEPLLEVNNGGLKTQTVDFQLEANSGGMENKL